MMVEQLIGEYPDASVEDVRRAWEAAEARYRAENPSYADTVATAIQNRLDDARTLLRNQYLRFTDPARVGFSPDTGFLRGPLTPTFDTPNLFENPEDMPDIMRPGRLQDELEGSSGTDTLAARPATIPGTDIPQTEGGRIFAGAVNNINAGNPLNCNQNALLNSLTPAQLNTVGVFRTGVGGGAAAAVISGASSSTA